MNKVLEGQELPYPELGLGLRSLLTSLCLTQETEHGEELRAAPFPGKCPKTTDLIIYFFLSLVNMLLNYNNK